MCEAQIWIAGSSCVLSSGLVASCFLKVKAITKNQAYILSSCGQCVYWKELV